MLYQRVSYKQSSCFWLWRLIHSVFTDTTSVCGRGTARIPGASSLLCIPASLKKNVEPVHCPASPRSSSLNHVANWSPAGENYCFTSIPASHQGSVGRFCLHRPCTSHGLKPVVISESGWVNTYTLSAPWTKEKKNFLQFQRRKKKPNSRNHLKGSQSPIKLECLVSISFQLMDFTSSIIIKLLLFLFSTDLFCLIRLVMLYIALVSEELVEVLLRAIWIILK